MPAIFGTFTYVVLSLLLTQVESAKFLLFGMQQASHNIELSATGLELIKRGHTVYRLVASAFVDKYRIRRDGIVDIEFESAQRMEIHLSDPLQEQFLFERLLDEEFSIDFLIKGTQKMADDCEDVLNDHKTLDKLRALKLDLAIIDGVAVMYCSFLIPYVLRIPYVSQTAALEFYMGGAPTLPSFITPGTSVAPPLHSDQKTFIQRLQSLSYQSFVLANARYDILGFYNKTLLKLHAPEIFSWHELVSRSSLFIILQDNALNWPQVTMPNIIISSMSRNISLKSLPPELENIVNDKHSKGVIVVSFGSTGSVPPNFFAMKLLNTFRNFNYTFIYRLQVDKINPPLKDIPKNVITLPWLPQVDLLAHPRTRLFIGHGGSGGQYEAICHSIPIIVIPMMADQNYNGFMLEQRGCGILLNLKTFQSADLASAMERILNNESFYVNTRSRSLIIQNNPLKARERIALWIEHILKFGNEHLRSAAVDLLWYEYFMIDVMLFVTIGTGLILTTVYKLIMFAFST